LVAPHFSGRLGFTLLEALVAMLISTLLVSMVASIFLVQNEFYADAVKKTTLHEGVRSAVALVSSELRGIPGGGIVVAEADSVTFRIPLVVGGVCGKSGSETFIYFPTGGQAIDPTLVRGYGVRDDTGAWAFTPAAWSSIYRPSGTMPSQTCRWAGADTTGATAEFYRLDGLVASPGLQAGDLVMLYMERTLRLGPSDLDSRSTGLFTGSAGGGMSEFSSGLTPASSFRYRLLNQHNWRTRVAGRNRERVAVIRFSAHGAAPSSRVGRDSLTFNLTSTVFLRNVH